MAGRPGKRYLLVLLLVITVGLAAFLVKAGTRYTEFDQAIQVMAQVKLRYVEPVSAYELFRAYLRSGTIDGMLKTLHDPYTRFLNPPEYRELRIQTNGTLGGVGVTLNYHGKSIFIMKALKGSPGEKAGLRSGDRIVKVNGRLTSEMSVDEAVAAIRGPAGTIVRLTITRGQGSAAKTWEVNIKRATIRLPSVEYEFLDDPSAGRIAFITLSQFADRTAGELESALRAADKANARGIILDLRYNPGGLLDAAIGVSSEFLEDGVVMYMLKRDNRRRPYYTEGNYHRHLPLVILVNQWSASASEIVAGALKDRGAATLVGTRTYGKGVVQEIVPISGRSALSVTVAKYLTAGGHSINKIGIEPDVKVDIPGAMDRAIKGGNPDELLRLERMQRQRAIEVLRAALTREKAAS